MRIGNREYEHIAVTDKNGAVIAVISDDEQHICYGDVQLMPNAVFYEKPYGDGIMLYAKPAKEDRK